MLPDSQYIVGDTARISAVFSSPATLTAVDPGALVLKIRQPDKNLVTLAYGTDAALIKDSIGHYHADIALPQPGIYYWRWEASAGNGGVAESSLTAIPSKVL